MNSARFVPAARREFLAEIVYYNQEQTGLGARFTAAVEEATARTGLSPCRFAGSGEYPAGVSPRLSLLYRLPRSPSRNRRICGGSSVPASRLLGVTSPGPLTNHCSRRGAACGRHPRLSSDVRLPKVH